MSLRLPFELSQPLAAEEVHRRLAAHVAPGHCTVRFPIESLPVAAKRSGSAGPFTGGLMRR